MSGHLITTGARWQIRPGQQADLPFICEIELQDEGATHPIQYDSVEWEKKKKFLGELVEAGGSWIVEADGIRIGIGLCCWNDPVDNPAEFLREWIDPGTLTPDGRFCCIYQLWVSPAWRRMGIGRRLKLAMEDGARQRGIRLIYTHTESRNTHVMALNLQLGYREIRRGPMWDNVERISLAKAL
jgi:GNAT superfamily N-acetyltransferase